MRDWSWWPRFPDFVVDAVGYHAGATARRGRDRTTSDRTPIPLHASPDGGMRDDGRAARSGNVIPTRLGTRPER